MKFPFTEGMLLKRRAEYEEHEERLAGFVPTFYFFCPLCSLFAPRYPLPLPVPRFSNIPSGILQRHIFVE